MIKYTEEKEYMINDQIINDNLPCVAQELVKNHFNILKTKMTVLASEVFEDIIYDDRDKLNLEESLNIT